MPHAGEHALRSLLPLLRQLREIRGLQEKKPGIFYRKGSAFLHFHDQGGALIADLKKAGGGTGFDRYPLATPQGQRRLVDDARRRAEGDDDD